jgi:transposase-like protein
MKDVETQQRFILMRAQGATYARIAQELGVAKGTLINWSRKFQFEIANQRAIELEALQEQLVGTREARLRALGDQLTIVNEELKKRNIADLSTARLFTLAASLRRQILSETGEPSFAAPVEQIPADEFHEQMQKWAA